MYTFSCYTMLVSDLKNLAAYSVIFFSKENKQGLLFLPGQIHWSTEDYYWASEQFILEIIQFPPASEQASVSGKSESALKTYCKKSSVMVEKAVSWESGCQHSGLSSEAHWMITLHPAIQCTCGSNYQCSIQPCSKECLDGVCTRVSS